MSFKPFFIHRRNHQNTKAIKMSKKMFTGFTVYVSPSDVPRTVNVQVAMCSRLDAFCRKTGREQALAKVPLAVNPRELPKFIADLENKMNDYDPHVGYNYVQSRDEEWLFKYML